MHQRLTINISNIIDWKKIFFLMIFFKQIVTNHRTKILAELKLRLYEDEGGGAKPLFARIIVLTYVLILCCSCGKYGSESAFVCNMGGDEIIIKTFKNKHKNILVIPDVCRNIATEKIRNAEVYYTSLPTCHISIESEDFENIKRDQKYKVYAEMSLYDASGECEYYGDIKIHTRGNGTFLFAEGKKPYSIKLNKKISLLGMRATKSYCLLNNVNDESMIRNAVSIDLGKEMGLTTPDYTYVQVYINGDYNGLYLMTNKIAIPDVVPICDLTVMNKKHNIKRLKDYPICETENGRSYKFDNLPEDYTGGYMLEITTKNQHTKSPCWFKSADEEWVRVRSPKYLSNEQMEYIATYWDNFEKAVISNDKSIFNIADIVSFAKYYVLNEFCMNVDFGIASTFFYKDSGKNSKIIAGPVWDFDASLYSPTWSHYIREINEIYAGSKLMEKTTSGGVFYNLLKNDDFKSATRIVYNEFFKDKKFVQKNYFDIIEAECDRMRWPHNRLYEGSGTEQAWLQIREFQNKRQKFLTWYFNTTEECKICININTNRRIIKIYAPKEEGVRLPDVYHNLINYPDVHSFDGYEDVVTGKVYKVGDMLYANTELKLHYKAPNKVEKWIKKCTRCIWL